MAQDIQNILLSGPLQKKVTNLRSTTKYTLDF